tara:strand:+ start:98 stop:340 length:243 start_codon:yes stop_codon:yes gene_type:complete
MYELVIRKKAEQIYQSAIRLDNDLNGNPRYYVAAYHFMNNGKFYNPKHATKYKGKKFGFGWVFQSYNLRMDLLEELKENA